MCVRLLDPCKPIVVPIRNFKSTSNTSLPTSTRIGGEMEEHPSLPQVAKSV